MAERILITSALIYANGSLHFGHIAGAYLPADCYARFQRLQGNEVLYISGSDEYGIAIALSAEMAGRTPREHVEIYHALNQEFFRQLNISFDHYSRTTWEGHTTTVQEFFKEHLKKGYIEERIENHLYSEEEQRFLADRYVVGICPKCGHDNARGDECTKCGATYEATDLKQPRSKMTGSKLLLKPSKHWYYRFDLFKERLTSWLSEKNWKSNVVSFTKNYLNDLHPRGITRDSTWGIPIPLPGTEGKVFYVWYDAPIGYISAVKEWAEKKERNPELWKKYWLDPATKLVHFIGKDNIPFHTLFFPAMLMGQESHYKLPDEVPANEFLTLEGRRFSKSDNWYIDLDTFFTKYSTDQIRYYLASISPEMSDTDFSWKEFQLRANGELLGKLGNFVNRTLVFLQNHFDGKIPEAKLNHEDLQFLQEVKKLVDEAQDAYKNFQLRRATQLLMELAQVGNVFFDYHKPWILVKDPSQKSRLEGVLYACLQCIQSLALVAFPIVPETAQKIWEMLGLKLRLSEENWEKVKERPLKSGQKIGALQLLFRKIEDAEIEEEIKKLKGAAAQKESFVPLAEEISIEDFEKIDLRVGQILRADPIPKSKKLYKLEVDLGFAKRQIVSGIAAHFEAKDLVGKKVVVVANLKPITLMGVESHGMLLAASLDGQMELPSFQALKPGSSIS